MFLSLLPCNAACDRAFEDQRYLPLLWEILGTLALQGKAKKKTYDAVDEARKVAVKCMRDVTDSRALKSFMSRWTDATLQRLSKSTQGDPASALPETAAIKLFHALLQAEAMPIGLTAQFGLCPQGWPYVDFAVRVAYQCHTVDADSGADLGRLGKGWGKRGASWGPRNSTRTKPASDDQLPQKYPLHRDSKQDREPEQDMWRGTANGNCQDNHSRPMHYTPVKLVTEALQQQAPPVHAPSLYTRKRVKKETDFPPRMVLPVESMPEERARGQLDRFHKNPIEKTYSTYLCKPHVILSPGTPWFPAPLLLGSATAAGFFCCFLACTGATPRHVELRRQW